MNLEALYVWDYTKDDLKELIDIIYINKMHLFFNSSSLKNCTLKHTWLKTIIR